MSWTTNILEAPDFDGDSFQPRQDNALSSRSHFSSRAHGMLGRDPSDLYRNNTHLVHYRPAKKKQCNCKNSKCLKLYCECFAARMYCDNCNCLGCCNNKESDHLVQKAVATTLERNPSAFRPKICSSPVPAGVAPGQPVPGRHSRGCHCKKSNCLKKYCECFQANILCGDNCKCQDCKNYDGSVERRALLRGSSRSPRSNRRTANSGIKNMPGRAINPRVHNPSYAPVLSTSAPSSSISSLSMNKKRRSTDRVSDLSLRRLQTVSPIAYRSGRQEAGNRDGVPGLAHVLLLAAKEEERNAPTSHLSPSPRYQPYPAPSPSSSSSPSPYSRPYPANELPRCSSPMPMSGMPADLGDLMKPRPSSCPVVGADFFSTPMQQGTSSLRNTPLPKVQESPAQERAVLEELSSFMKKTVELTTQQNGEEQPMLRLAPLCASPTMLPSQSRSRLPAHHHPLSAMPHSRSPTMSHRSPSMPRRSPTMPHRSPTLPHRSPTLPHRSPILTRPHRSPNLRRPTSDPADLN